METRLVSIGNSRGVRIPKAILEQCGLENRVIVTVREDGLLLSPPRPRAGWEEALLAAGVPTEDEFDDLRGVGNAFDDGEWQWSK